MGQETTVVIPTRNRASTFERCLESVLGGRSLPASIIVCDQSTDDYTRQAAEKYLNTGVNIEYIRLSMGNAAGARNAGTELAQTPLVAYIDDDCVALPEWLQELEMEWERSRSLSDVVAIAGGVHPLVERGATSPIASRTGSDRIEFNARDRGMQNGDWAPWDVGTGANLLISRAAFERVEGFDTSMGPGTPDPAGEDVEMLYRLTLIGTVVYCPGAIVLHPAQDRAGRLKSRYKYGRGMGAMLAKHLRARTPAAAQITKLWLRHQAGNVLRKGVWGPPEVALSYYGAAAGLTHHLWTYPTNGADGRKTSTVRSAQSQVEKVAHRGR